MEDLPLDFERSPFLKAIWLDQSPRIVIEKPVKTGISEWAVCDSFASADVGMRVLYVLPKIALRDQFVRDRVDRLLRSVPYYRSRVGRALKEEGVLDIDNVGLKAFGERGVLLFVGSNARDSFISFTADKVVVDEYDFCDQDNLALVEDRLKASRFKHRIDISTPTLPDWGIDVLYQKSDKKTWMIKCQHCKEWQAPHFFKNVVREVDDNEYELIDEEWTEEMDRDIFTICTKCGKPFNPLSPGNWVAEHPGRKLSGYGGFEQLVSANMTVAEVFSNFKDALLNDVKFQVFMNSDCGTTYVAKGQKLTRAILEECVKAGLMYNLPSRADGATAGVDVGRPLLHVWICDHPQHGFRRTVWVGTVREFEELHTVFAKYGVKWAVIDADPETRKAREFQEVMKGKCRVWLCRYPPAPQVEALKMKEDTHLIVADRTQACDGFVADIYQQGVLLPGNASSLDDGDFYAQLCVPTRVLDGLTGRYYWVDRGKADHYFHSGVYEKIATGLMGKPSFQLPPPEERQGYPRDGFRGKGRHG